MGWGLSKNFEGLIWGCWGPSPGPGTKGWVREVQGHRLYVGLDPPWGSEWKCRGFCPHCQWCWGQAAARRAGVLGSGTKSGLHQLRPGDLGLSFCVCKVSNQTTCDGQVFPECLLRPRHCPGAANTVVNKTDKPLPWQGLRSREIVGK